MDRRRQLWLLLPPEVRALPADLALVIAATALTVLVVVLPGVNETPLRVLLGLPFVLFLPGYAFIASLFPEAGEAPTAAPDGAMEPEPTESRLRDRGIDGIERVALSFGLSIAIVPLIGLGLNFTPWGIRLTPILVSVSTFTVGCAIVAQYRRRQLPPEDRFVVPFDAWLAAARAEVFQPVDRTDAALNVLLAVSIVLALATVGYAIAVPPQGERFTEFYILMEDGDDDLVAADYPTDFVRGESQEIVLGIENNEHEMMNYTVVIQVQEEEFANNESTILQRSELDRFPVQLAHNETWREPVVVAPDLLGEDLRLQYLLYAEGEVPEAPDRSTAYRDVHLWVNVTDGS